MNAAPDLVAWVDKLKAWAFIAIVLFAGIFVLRMACRPRVGEKIAFQMVHGRRSAREGEYAAAIKHYTEALKLNPDLAKAYFARGLAHAKSGDGDAAIRDYTKAIETSDAYPFESLQVAYYNRAAWWIKRNDAEQALRDLNLAIEADPGYAHAYKWRGWTYFAGFKDDARAIDDCTKAIELDPTDAETFGFRGRAYFRKREYARAEEDFTKALELEPDEGELHWRRAQARSVMGQYDSALADCTKAIELGDADGYWLRSVIRRKAGDLAGALEDINEGIRLEPQDPFNYSRRAMSYVCMGSFDDAAKDSRRYAEAKEESGSAAVWLYLARARAGETDAASDLRAALAKVKDGAWQAVMGIYLGTQGPDDFVAAAQEGRYGDEMSLGRALFYVGEYHLLSGQIEEAHPCFEQALAEMGPHEYNLVNEYEAAKAELARLGE